jgi:hypothetical protein
MIRARNRDQRLVGASSTALEVRLFMGIPLA